MKKLTLTSILAISIAVPSYADIASTANSATCNNDTLETTSGSSTLEASWTANTINLKWYNGDTEVTPSNSTASTCTYDSGITLPSNTPTKTGYIFSGWKVKPSAFDLSTLDSTKEITYYTSVSLDNTYCEGFDVDADDGSFGVDEGGSCSDAAFTGMGTGEWRITAEYGTVKGKAVCATNSGTSGKAGTPVGTSGKYCWCQVTGYDAEKDGTYMPVSSSSWVFDGEGVNADYCATNCAKWCADDAKSDDDFRAVLFGISK